MKTEDIRKTGTGNDKARQSNYMSKQTRSTQSESRQNDNRTKKNTGFPKKTSLGKRILRTLWLRPINLVAGAILGIFRSPRATSVYI